MRDAHVDVIEHVIEKRSEENRLQYAPKGFLAKKKARKKLTSHINSHWKSGLYKRVYQELPHFKSIRIPTSDQLKRIYESTNKLNPKDFLNCSSCGYRNCEEMAIALHNGLTKPENCRHYVEHIAERETQAVIQAKDDLYQENETHSAYLNYLSGKLSDLSKQSDEIKSSIDESIQITNVAQEVL